MRNILLVLFVLIGCSVHSQNEKQFDELFLSGGVNFGRVKKYIPIKIGENNLIQPVFFENFYDRSIFSINYMKKVKSIHTFGIGLSYRNAQKYNYSEQISNRFRNASFSMYGLSFTYSRKVFELNKFQFYVALSPVLNYAILDIGANDYYIKSKSEETNVDLIYVEGFETIAEERTILPEVKCMLMCKFGLGNNVSFFSSFGTDSFIVRSDVAPEKYSLMFLLDFGISIVLQ